MKKLIVLFTFVLFLAGCMGHVPLIIGSQDITTHAELWCKVGCYHYQIEILKDEKTFNKIILNRCIQRCVKETNE